MFSNKIQIIEAKDIQKTSASSSYGSTMRKLIKVLCQFMQKKHMKIIFFL